MDNAGENVKLSQRMNGVDWKLNVETKWTARNTPQQNSVAETAISVINDRALSMMHAANVPDEKRKYYFNQARDTAAFLDGLAVVELNGKMATRFEHAFGSNPLAVNHLRTWGEAGTVTLKSKTRPKETHKGSLCMFVGHAKRHAGDCCVMWDPHTGGVHTTRDVIWMGKMFCPPKVMPKAGITAESHRQPTEPKILDMTGADKTDHSTDDVNESASTQEAGESGIEEHKEDPSEDEGSELETETTWRRVGGQRQVESPLRTEMDRGAKQTTTLRSGRISKRSITFDPSNKETIPDERATEALERHKQTDPEAESTEVIEALCLAAINEVKTEKKQVTEPELHLIEVMEAMHQAGMITTEEFSLVGAGLLGGFTNTQELKVMTYDEAMEKGPKAKWLEAVEQEDGRMNNNSVWTPKKTADLRKGDKVIDTTWAMKKKASGEFRARLVAGGFKQEEGIHHNKDDLAAPVVNDITIKIMFVLQILADYCDQLVDVKGAFLIGSFDNGEVIHIKVPKGLQHKYPKDIVSLLLKTIHGTKQAAVQFHKELTACFRDMGHQKSEADPCVFYKEVDGELIVWMSWVDDLRVMGPKELVMKEKAEFQKRFDCSDIGDVDEYVGCKVDRAEGTIKMTQPVLLQSYQDEFDTKGGETPQTPAAPGTTLKAGTPEECLSRKDQSVYRKGVGKLLHMTRWTRPDAFNAVRELSRFGGRATAHHMKALIRTMKYLIGTPNRGWTMKPNRKGDLNTKLLKMLIEVSGESDSDYAKDLETRKSVVGWNAYVENALVSCKSKMMPIVALSVTEAELFAATMLAQDMLFIMRILESIGLKVKLPMTLYLDNSGAKDLMNSWSVGGRTRHVEVKQYFLRELKEYGLIRTAWISGDRNPADVHTKNLSGADFAQKIKSMVGEDEY